MGPNGEEVETAAIITTNANRHIAKLHSRMPVVIPAHAFDLWLDCSAPPPLPSPDGTPACQGSAPYCASRASPTCDGGGKGGGIASAMLEPAPEELFEAYEISSAVNRTANDGPQLIEPVTAGSEEPPALGAIKPRKLKDERQPSLFDDL
jgi:hypothetical protein